MLILECPKLLVRECNMMWAPTTKSQWRCSRDGLMTGRCGKRGSELTQSWRVGPWCSRWQKCKQRRSRWLGRLLIRFDWARSSVMFCWRTKRAKLSALFISHQGEHELRLGGFYTQNTRNLREHVWAIWYVMWYARENTGWPM